MWDSSVYEPRQLSSPKGIEEVKIKESQRETQRGTEREREKGSERERHRERQAGRERERESK